MREYYHSELEEIVNELVIMSDSVQIAVRDATRSLLEADLTLAERVISGDMRLDAMHDALERKSFSLLARQAPVAGELRILVAAMRMTADLGRMGDLAAHVAEIARMRYPEHAVPDRLRENFVQMSQIAQDMVAEAGRTLAERNVAAAEKMAADDTVMDELRNTQFRVLLGDDWAEGVEKAVDVALLGRYYERIADHAVAMAGRVIYMMTGELPVGEDWPTT